MITIKSRREFDRMQVAGACVSEILRTVREAAIPGASLTELDDLARKVLENRNCTPSFLGYHGFPAVLCLSVNDVVVHGIPDDYQLREGDILAVDAGAIFEGFHGDAAFTMGIGEISADATRLIDVTNEAMWAAVRITQPGTRLGDIGSTIEKIGLDAGYGVVRDYVGHGIGRQMHEEPQVPNYGTPGKGMKLRTGMAICIEPQFTVGAEDTTVDDDGWTVRTADGSLAAHWEHTVALTKDGTMVFTAGEEALSVDLVDRSSNE